MQTKKQSINAQLFVVTVLSAWLGLMIVSIPTQVYSQSVNVSKNQASPNDETKSSNETANEIDLNLPDSAFSEPVLTFIDDVRKLVSIDKYKFSERAFTEITISARKNSTGFTLSASSNNGWINEAATIAAESLRGNLPHKYKFYRYDEKLNAEAEQCTIEFLLENSELVVTTKYELASDEQAKKLASTFNSFFAKNICECNDESDRIIYQNTKALTERNQVLIVTRLPRGSLDALLAAK